MCAISSLPGMENSRIESMRDGSGWIISTPGNPRRLWAMEVIATAAITGGILEASFVFPMAMDKPSVEAAKAVDERKGKV